MRIDPPPSDPCAIGSIPEATAAPDPPLDPPAVCRGFQGLRVGAWVSGSTTGIAPISEVESLPRITKPPSRSEAVVRSSIGEKSGSVAREPIRVHEPRTKLRSLIPIGTPWNVGSVPPARTRRSFSRASARARR